MYKKKLHVRVDVMQKDVDAYYVDMNQKQGSIIENMLCINMWMHVIYGYESKEGILEKCVLQFAASTCLLEVCTSWRITILTSA